MKYRMRLPSRFNLATCGRIAALIILVFAVGQRVRASRAGKFEPNVYVPYEDLAQLIEPEHKAMLMDRGQFEKLLAAAEATARQADSIELGQVEQADYSGKIEGEKLTLTGKLKVVSLGKGPVAVPLGFAKIGLTSVTLDGKPAPLGYNKQGRLTLIVTAGGSHEVEIAGTTKLEELSSGGMQFGMSLPAAVAASMKLTAPGDLEIHATSPVSKSSYNEQADRTDAELTLGGQGTLTVVLLGNGRQDQDQTILLGESAATVRLTRSHKVLGCLYTVQALRRGSRELRFSLPPEWTVTNVTCPDLVRWSVDAPAGPAASQTLSVRLRSEKVGATALHIEASAVRKDDTWRGPRVVLLDAAYQRGYLMVNTDEGLSVRGEKLTDARREDLTAVASVRGIVGGPGGRLYFHWGRAWSVSLELTAVELRRSIKERQRVFVSPDRVALTGQFEVTAIDRELFDMSFVLRGPEPQWQIKTVLVDKKQTGFEYRVEKQAGRRLLKIELPRPIQPEKLANVVIELQHVPSDWQWPSDAAARDISVPLIESQAQTVSGHVMISALEDLDALPQEVPAELEVVPVGQMASLGIDRSVQYAYSYNAPAKDRIQLQVSRRRPRLSGDAVGLIAVEPREFTGDWRITYTISRASAKRLYLLADKSLGEEIRITSATVPISSKSIVTPGWEMLELSDELSEKYDLWLLNLDHKAVGAVVVDIHYERPRVSESFRIPLVRPMCEGQISEQLAIQASEELALTIDANQAREIDAVDLPPLPLQASRVLAAFRLDSATTAAGPQAAVTLKTAVHENYEIPSALATSAQLTTYIDPQGGQRTESRFNIANAGKQFLTIRLPEGAELWSLRIGDAQAKPQQSAQGDYQVAIRQSPEPTAVKIVYAYQPDKANTKRLKLGGVELPGVEMNQVSWIVIPPPGYRVATQQTKMQTRDLPRPRPAYMQVYDFFVRHGPLGIPSLGRVQRFALSQKMAIDTVGGDAVRRLGYRYGDRGAAPGAAPARKPEEAYTMQQRAEAEEPKPTRPPRPAVPQAVQPAKPKTPGVRLAGEGRFTLPVDLVPTPGAGPQARFAGLGTAELIIGLSSQSRRAGWWALGFVLIVAAGVGLAREAARVKTILVIAVLSAASLLAVWRPATTNFANGAFAAGASLVLLYILVWFVRWLWGRLFSAGTVSLGSMTAVVLLALLFCLDSTARAAKAVQAAPAATRQRVRQPAPQPKVVMPDVIIPYEGDPAAAEQSDKILIPYTRFVELWNKAHPEDPIDGLKPGAELSLSDVRYTVTVQQEQLDLLLESEVETYGKDWVVLDLPISSLAVTEAKIDGKPAQLHTGPKGMVLMVPGGTSGRLELRAVAKPQYMGRRGSASFSLPPLPGAVMKVVLPQNDLELEVDDIEGALTRRAANGTVEYTFGLGMTRKLTLRWLPKIGRGAADRTLSADSQHDVYAFHWAVVGVSKIAYSFSSGEHDRFVLLVPKGTTLTDVKGTNIRDFRPAGEQTVEGKLFDLVEVRLHRAAQKKYELTVRWLSELPALDEPIELAAVRAGQVSRESGTVTLYSAGGMGVKVVRVSGGRRTNVTADRAAQGAELAADRAEVVAKYYWPYRPFSLFVQLSRLAVSPKVHLDQLVRISTDRVELLVQANLRAEDGKLFGASFILPGGYELLSAVGPAVESFYESSSENGRFLHVKFNRGRQQTDIALMLVRKDVRPESFDVPMIMYLDSEGRPLSEQQGRLAVQVAASLEAETAASENLKSISPQTLKDWLDAGQTGSVQFAYRYETAGPSLKLTIRSLPTQIRVETFAGLVVRATAAVYTYRLRYDITGSPVDELSFRLPSEYAPLVAVESAGMRSVTQSTADGQTTWKVSLVNEVTGLVDVAVNFALPIDASTKVLRIPTIYTEAAAGYSAIVAVQNMSRHDISVKDSTNLSELAASEQQKLMPREMRESLQYVFQSFDDGWAMSLDFSGAKMAVRIQAVVDLLAVTTVLDRNGRCRYEAKVALQNRSEQFLRVKMPEGLRLWSANVAGQPVKPVVAPDSPEGQVLIPLVKTSPGGLPYDVYLYFADEGPEPLIVPLNGITRLKPPAISIVGIPVMQTTWSLRLPGGYRYMRPRGNMSPVAGTVEVLSLGIEAKLEQLKRLEKSYRDVAGSSAQREQIAKRNWELFNQKLANEIQQTESYLSANRSQVSEEDYRRLRAKLGGQRQRQDLLLGSNASFVQKQQEQAGKDLNLWLNVDASNAGVAEIVRNEAMLQKPGFLSKSEEQQIVRLQHELQASEQQIVRLQKELEASEDHLRLPALQREGLGVTAEEEPYLRGDRGKQADELILDFQDKKAEMGEILGDLAQTTQEQIGRKQAQLKGQLEQLRESRLQRHFKAESDRVLALQSQAEQQARGRGALRAEGEDSFGAAKYDYGRRTRTDMDAAIPESRPTDARTQTAAGVRGLAREPAAVAAPAGPATGQPLFMDGAASQEMPFYVAKGIYSLPVTLPEGEVRLDFARPSGEAELSILAVPLSTISSFYRTLAVFVGLLVVVALAKLWRTPEQKRPISAPAIVVYALLFVGLTVLLGLPGLLISLFLVLLGEVRRGAFIRCPAA